MNIRRFFDCRYCIDGNMPAGTHDIFREVYTRCPVCLPLCPLCEGEGLFPARFTCLECFIARLAGLGLAPVICADCTGVVDLIPSSYREVTCHAHHC